MRIRVVMRAAAVVAMVLVFRPAFGATVTWNAGGGTESWSNPLNWSTNSVPTSSDDVVINSAGTGTVRVDVTAIVNSITVQVNAELLIENGKTIMVNNASTVDVGGVLALDNSSFSGSGALTVNGELSVISGVLDGGALTINSSGLMELLFTTVPSIISRTTTNAGTIQIDDSGYPGTPVTLDGITLTNTGLIVFQADYGINGVSSPILNNNSGGVIRKSA